MSIGIVLIAAERRDQVEDHGWSREHDLEHEPGVLLAAAGCYLAVGLTCLRPDDPRAAAPVATPPASWPWENAWKPSFDDPLPNLVKAGALIAAEIDRLVGAAVTADAELPPEVQRAGRDAAGKAWLTSSADRLSDAADAASLAGYRAGLAQRPALTREKLAELLREAEQSRGYFDALDVYREWSDALAGRLLRLLSGEGTT